MKESSTNKPPAHRYLGLLAFLFLVPLALFAGKNAGWPLSDWLNDHVSLTGLPHKVQENIGHVLFIPLAAIFVVFTRLTLGIRVLGPFRSILLAWAFKYTGILPGTFFLVLTVGTLVVLRRPIKSLKLPYFGRITIMLSGVAAVMTALLLFSDLLDTEFFHAVTHLPVVVLCLISEAFATKLSKEGQVSAVWKMSTTVLLAIGISLLASWPALRIAMIHYPETLLVQMGLIIVIARFCAFRIFDRWNLGADESDESDKELLGREYVADGEDQRQPALTPAGGWSLAKSTPVENRST